MATSPSSCAAKLLRLRRRVVGERAVGERVVAAGYRVLVSERAVGERVVGERREATC